MSNYKFKTTNIRGKKYVEINERIKYLRQEAALKNYSIMTEFLPLTVTCVYANAPSLQSRARLAQATLTRSAGHPTSTRQAMSKTETSAVGRALAFLGIGIDTSIASDNEVQEAIAKQNSPASTEADAPVENIMDKAVTYIKSQTDKQKAFDSIYSKYKDQLTEKQVAGLKKFVR